MRRPDRQGLGRGRDQGRRGEGGYAYTFVRPGQLFGGPYDNNVYLGTLFQLDKDVDERDVLLGRGDVTLNDDPQLGTLRSTRVEINQCVGMRRWRDATIRAKFDFHTGRRWRGRAQGLRNGQRAEHGLPRNVGPAEPKSWARRPRAASRVPGVPRRWDKALPLLARVASLSGVGLAHLRLAVLRLAHLRRVDRLRRDGLAHLRCVTRLRRVGRLRRVD